MSDLIDRQKVLETIDSRIEQIKKNTNAMNKSYPHLSFAEGVHDGYCRLKCDLRILPSVSVSENPNKCGDLISRQAVLDGIAEWIVSGYADSEADCSHISSLVTHLPSVENKGEWSRHTRVEPVYSIDGVKTWGDKCQCNRCTFTTIAVEGFGYYNFCPNCGADMRGET